MDVVLERYKRPKLIGKKDSPMLYYLRQKTGDVKMMKIDSLSEIIESKTSLSASDVKHVIEELVDQIRLAVTSGIKVKVNGLGIFYLSLRCKGEADEKECGVRSIHHVSVSFLPDRALRLGNASLEKVESKNNVAFDLYKPKEESTTGGGTGHTDEGEAPDPIG